MSIVAASQQPSVIEAAFAYARLGFSVIAYKGKLPSVYWIPHQTQRASLRQLAYWHNRGLMPNVGIVTGAVSGNLVVADLDGLKSVATFEFEFPELLNTYTVASGSGEGKHIYYYVDRLPTSKKIKGYELRADKLCVVAPPSCHKSGKNYAVANPVEIMRVPNLDRVVEFIEDKRKESQPETVKTTSSSTPPLPAINNAYGMTALHNECRNISTTMVNINDQLNLSAFKLGQLVGLGFLSESLVESELLKAAAHLSAKDGENLSIKTIRSGLNAGKKKMDTSRGALK